MRISFREFMRVGVPVMLFTLVIASVYLAGSVLLGSDRVPYVMLALIGVGAFGVWRTEQRAHGG